FCPISQIDLKFVENLDEYVGETYPFLIVQFEENGRNIVISRRELLKRDQESAKNKFYEQITVGTELDGKVTRLMPYGAFVEIFPGVEGMVHLSEISWSRIEKADKILKAGDSIKVKIIKIRQVEGHDRLQIALSIKQITGDPWERVEENFHDGDKVMGRVTQCKKFGAFVEIAPGIEGLVHISEMSYRKRVLKPEDLVKAGDTVSVVIKEIDAAKRKISLSLRDAEGDPWTGVQERYNEGQSIEGLVEKKEKFGYFITIEPGITGLLPQSKIKSSLKPQLIEKLRQGDTIPVIIQKIDLDKRKITLAPGDSRNEEDWRNFAKPSKKPIGSLGEKLQQALTSRKG
ncbi:MAG: S1 RNA-binding domain-containing protein, partial [Thermodesulfobacteriota bacterium]|nr:S1 RNA-binding domain-containing protein [Thermodesulfobacteriota bacterium]